MHPPDPRSGKLAEQVAMALCDDVELAGWPIGVVIGSESGLIERHHVSRAVFREAVRILEHHGAVRTKRGPGGGVLASVPDLVALRRSLRLYLERAMVTANDLVQVRILVEGEMARLAAERIGSAGADRLRGQLAAGVGPDGDGDGWLGLHRCLADITGNRLLVLFVDVLDDLMAERTGGEDLDADDRARTARSVRRAHRRIVDAVVTGDGEGARRRMVRHIEASRDVLR